MASVRRGTARQRGEFEVCSLCLDPMCLPNDSKAERLRVCTSCHHAVHGSCWRQLCKVQFEAWRARPDPLRVSALEWRCPTCRCNFTENWSSMVSIPKERRTPLTLRVRRARDDLREYEEWKDKYRDDLNASLEARELLEKLINSARENLARLEKQQSERSQVQEQLRAATQELAAAQHCDHPSKRRCVRLGIHE